MTVSLGIELLMKVRCVFQSQHSRHVTEAYCRYSGVAAFRLVTHRQWE
jgi:hypothetical protein